MPEHLGDVDAPGGALIIYGLDFIEVADPDERVATTVANVMVIRNAESWGVQIEPLRDASVAVHGEHSGAELGIWESVTIRFAAGTSTERRQVGEVLSRLRHLRPSRRSDRCRARARATHSCCRVVLGRSVCRHLPSDRGVLVEAAATN